MIKSISFVLLTLVSGSAFAQDPVALKRTAKEGEVLVYKLVVDTEVQGMTIKFSSKVRETTTKVEPAGTFSVKSEQFEAVLDMNGQEQTMPDGASPSSTTTYNAEGGVVKIEGEEATEEAYRLANLQTLFWPKEKVSVGSKWSLDVAPVKDKSSVAMKASYEVLAMETLRGRETAKISFDSKESTGDTPAGSKGTVWVDVKTGQTIKVDAEWTNVPIAGQVISGKLKLEIAE